MITDPNSEVKVDLGTFGPAVGESGNVLGGAPGNFVTSGELKPITEVIDTAGNSIPVPETTSGTEAITSVLNAAEPTK